MNILLITADQLRADALGCYGNPVCRTPALDALAASGTVFDQAFTPCPISVPARASLTTGNYPHRATGMKENGGSIRDGQYKVAEYFDLHGYRTYACGKLHYAPYAPPGQPRVVHGFDHWDSAESGRIISKFDPTAQLRGLEDYSDYLADVGWRGYSRAHGIGNNDVRPCPSPLPAEHHVDHWVADRTIQRLRQHTAEHHDQPFLIWCSFPKPHAPLDPPMPWAHMYDPRQVPPPVGDESMLATRNPHLEFIRANCALGSLSPEARRVAKAYYYGLVSFQDAQVARILATLDELGVTDDTIILYTADHGDLMGDFGVFFKSDFRRGSVSVPFIMAGPGVPCGQRLQTLVGLQDILPTLAAMTGHPLAHAVDGLDMRPVLRDPAAAVRQLYYAQCYDSPRQLAMVTDGRWKYCYSQMGAVEELYNLQDDPHELVNLAAEGGDHRQLSCWRQALTGEAQRLGDVALIDAVSPTGLVQSPLDRWQLRNHPANGMGWRWY
ncbi:MAG: sulfatase-like hydrolase/transferase [Phycisphaeraceae bacterium]